MATTGFFTGRIIYAIGLVGVFGVGMALTLIGIALATQQVRARIDRGHGLSGS